MFREEECGMPLFLVPRTQRRHLTECVFHGGFVLGESQAGRVEERSEQGAGGVQSDAYFGAGKFIEQPSVASCRDNQALAA